MKPENAVRACYAELIEPRSIREDDRRRERILNIILVGSIAMLAVFDGILFYYSLRAGAGYREMSVEAFSVIVAFFVFLFALSRRGFFVVASYLLVTGYFVAVSYAAFRWGVNLPSALLGYAILITVASILLGTWFGFIMTGVIALFILVLWHFQFYGIFPPGQNSIPNNSDALVFSVLFCLLTTVAWLSNREIEKSLTRARTSEQALKDERDLLEVKVEERTRELQVAQLEKIDHLYRFAEFGQLASGLFHDLTSILSALSLRVEGNENDTVAVASLNNALDVQTEIGRFTEAVRKQLNRESAEEMFSLKRSVESAMQLLTHSWNAEHIKLSFDFADNASDPMVEYFGDQSKFHQVIVNLLMNAIESFDGISKEPENRKRIVIELSKEGNVVVLRVHDNGKGISPAVQAKIFDPFFTTKYDKRKGMGIGLAITKRIVENDFQGTIAVTSFENNGTTFIIRFPFHRQRPRGDQPRPAS